MSGHTPTKWIGICRECRHLKRGDRCETFDQRQRNATLSCTAYHKKRKSRAKSARAKGRSTGEDAT